MKKYLMTAIAAVAMGAAFTSCSHSLDVYNSGDEEIEKEKYTAELRQAEYEALFENVFGKPDPNHMWGFESGSASTRALTRTITVNGDSYNKFPSTSEINSFFPTDIPEGADEVSELLSKYQGTTAQTQWGETTMWDLYAIYANKIVEGYNLKVTSDGTYTNNVVELGGSYQNSGWDATAGKELARPYNVYVNINGNLTIKRNGATHFNLYILSGNVTLESNYGEQAGIISVASGATLTDQRNSIAANQGIKLYNRGTVNATNPEKYDIGNFSTVYNEGTFNVTGPLTYSPGDANTSFFMNHGDNAVLTAPAMTMNSSGNFFNDGTVTITNATTVTNDGIFWVNAGHYTTGSMVFSAKNTTFYNYCNLICRGNAHMYDGEFNLMDNSYTEAGSAEMDNFVVNMGSNTGMNIKGNLSLTIGQGDGTYQGFQTSGSNDFLRVAGTVTVAEHRLTLELTGDITYAFNNLVDLGANNTGVQPTYRFNAGTTEAQFDKLTVTPNENSCGATWEYNNSEYDGRVMAEDLNAKQKSDFDFNDVVFDWKIEGNKVKILIKAAGGIYPLYVGDATHEVHAELGHGNTDADGHYPMINTGAGPEGTAQPFYYTFDGKESITVEDVATIPVWVVIDGDNVPLNFARGKGACKFNTKPTTKWLREYCDITWGYPDFKKWVSNHNYDWTKNKVEEYLY